MLVTIKIMINALYKITVQNYKSGKKKLQICVIVLLYFFTAQILSIKWQINMIETKNLTKPSKK